MALANNDNEVIELDGYGQRSAGLPLIEEMTAYISLDGQGQLILRLGQLHWQGTLDQMFEALACLNGAPEGYTVYGANLFLRRVSDGRVNRRVDLWLFTSDDAYRPRAIAKLDLNQLTAVLSHFASRDLNELI